MRSRLFLLLCLSFAFHSFASAADWPAYLNGNDRIGATSEKLPQSPRLQWTLTLPTAPKTAWEGPRDTPIEGHVMKHRVAFDRVVHTVIGDGKVYYGSSVDHRLVCMDAGSGKTLWSFFTAGPIRLAPTLHAGKVYFGSDDGKVYCLDGETGKQVWALRVGPKDERLLARGEMISRWPVRTGVLIDVSEKGSATAYFGAGIFPHENVYLCAADAATGKLLWKNDHISQKDAGRNDLSPQGYLLANEDLLFVPSGRTMPAAFEKKTGKFVYKKSFSWRTSGGGVIGGSKAVLADGQLYSAGAHHFLALNEKTGSAGFAYIPGRQITFREGMAYIANGKAVIAVDRDKHAAASVERQKLFIQRRSARGNAKKLAEIDRKMAELAKVGIAWQAKFSGDSALILAGDAVIAGGEGKAAAFDIKTGESRWSAEVEGEAAGLALGDGRLLVSTSAGKIYGYAAGEISKPAQLPEASQDPFPQDPLADQYQAAAKQILETSKIDGGFCLVMGSENGHLAYELAKQAPKLKIYGVEQDADKVAASRESLRQAGLYGHRVVIVHAQPAETPLANYFANLTVSDSMLTSGKLPAAAVELGRYVKPCGGVVCWGSPKAFEAADATSGEALKQEMLSMYLRDDAEVQWSEPWAVLRRGKLADVGEWSHQYGNVSNTCFTQDHRVKGSLGVLWYGDPGPQKMINRHEAASAPLSTNGRFFIQGTDSVRGYDAYNGQFLWEYKNPGAIRTGVFNNNETSNLAANDDALFVCAGDTCTMLDAASGKTVHEFKAVQSDDGIPRAWGYVAHHDGALYGTSTIRKELAASLRRRGRKVGGDTDAIFAVDLKTQKPLWTYRGENIMHVTITIGDGKMFFIESTISEDERRALLAQDKTDLKNLTPEQAKKKEAELKKLDVRRVVCLDARTGREYWRTAVDVTSCSGISSGGGELALMHHDKRLLICGANANGHYWRQFLSGQFKKRRLVVLESDEGKKLWGKDADYMNRPAIVGEYVFAEPWAFDLHTGEERKRSHPVTGQQTQWRFSRPGHHCGVITATPNMMFFRSGFIGYYDLYADSGTKHFAGQRLGCWVNAIPGNGLVMIPEASAGCVCLFSIASTVVLEPRQDRDPSWGIYSAVGPQTPVKRLGVNLGAPGDRRDGSGDLWLGYPRPNTRGRLEYTFNIQAKLATGGEYYDWNAQSVQVEGAQTPWLMASGAKGLSRCELPLLGKDDQPASYKVKLHFVNGETPAGKFDIRLQGEVVARAVDLAKEAGGVNRAVLRQFENVPVEKNLVLEIVSSGGEAPALAAIEVVREE